jgi:hypothetical protein
MKYLIIFFLLLCLHADSNVSAVFNSIYDEYQHSFTQSLHVYSENVDRYISSSDEAITYNDDTEKTSLDMAPFITLEDRYDSQFRFKFHASVKLPRTSKILKLSLENFNESDSIDDYGNHTGNNNNNDYLLGLEYFSYDKNMAMMRFGAGIKTNNGNIDPYFSFTMRKYLYINEWHLTLSEKLRYFLNIHVDNRIEANLGYFINSTTKFRLINSYRYKDEDSSHELTNILRIHKLLSNKKNIYADLNIYSFEDDKNKFDISYYKAGIHFYHRFYKNWIYYEVEPSLMFRIENAYKPTARIFLSIGVLFGKSYYHGTDIFYRRW